MASLLLAWSLGFHPSLPSKTPAYCQLLTRKFSMRTIYRTGNAGSVRLSARTPSDDLSPLDERGNRQQIEPCLRERVGVEFSHQRS